MIDINENPLVSVIMATYNGDKAEYRLESINSILKQTYTNFELILSVDGSVSAIVKIDLLKIEKLDSRIKLLWNEKNLGPASARNKAIAIAQGKYICVLDADDIAFPDRIEKQYLAIKEKQIDLLGSSYIEFDTFDNLSINNLRCMPLEHALIVKNISFFCSVANPTIFAKSSIMKKFLYNEKYKVGEDYALFIDMLKLGVKMGNIAEPTIYYRRGSDFLKRRGGLKYAKTDFINKVRAASLVSIYSRPIVYFLAVCTFFIRLLPPNIFNIMRNLRHVILRKN